MPLVASRATTTRATSPPDAHRLTTRRPVRTGRLVIAVPLHPCWTSGGRTPSLGAYPPNGIYLAPSSR